MTKIFMPLLNEGTDVWRPVEATLVDANSYRVEGTPSDGEEWAYGSGTIVLCEWNTLSSGERGLVIISRVS
ncbi:hypothetical protein HFP51_02960 [Parasphingopyxis sp. CP4]|uniref:hypothetical protein n=1 Tax=Parasphingopyxis sp. CP4 TaxID=2724527 RepID=UPI0015A45808|nr:hypothetical protein [Parasphingopyxis sp. CP4]QLC21236.1 hypothetical protein HFP51_02960 [Parasphingopyxis sp. CP4]